MAMSPLKSPVTIAEKYDHALHYARDNHLPEDQPRPKPTAFWPPENIQFLEKYHDWLVSGGASQQVIRNTYMPMAGHVLGLFLKPYTELDIQRDLEPAADYIRAKGLSAIWSRISITGLLRFRRFICQERGIPEPDDQTTVFVPNTTGLPTWVVRELVRLQHTQERNWRPARHDLNLRRFWSGHLRVWRFLCKERGVTELADIKRRYLYDFTEMRLKGGYAVKGINADLRNFKAFLSFLQEQDYPVSQSLIRVPTLKEPDSLPRFLTDAQVALLRQDFEERVKTAEGAHRLRDALLDRAAFYLLWQGGMRLGEVEELLLDDLALDARKLTVRQGKGQKDRTVYLTPVVVRTLEAYLAVRGQGPTEHVFLYRNLPLKKDLVRDRIKAAGRRVGVKVYPHRLRHTCATQLLNAGCKVTSIQRFLGHQDLQSTLVYAKVHDHVVAEDYFSAMAQVEQRLELASASNGDVKSATPEELVALLDALQDSHLDEAQAVAITAVREGILLLAKG
jgi:site-specific recombinase XerD